MRFLSTLVASTIGTFIALGLILIFGILFIAMLAVSAGGVEPRVRDGAVLRMELSGSLPEYKDQTLADLSTQGGQLTIRDVVEAVEKATSDDRISGIWIVSEGLRSSWAGLLEVREALDAFKDTERPIFASTGPNGYSEPTYFLSSAADSIYAAPQGVFQIDGFHLSVEFYAGLMEKLNVRPQIVRAGKFKSAVEPFLREDLSIENRAQLQALVDKIDSVFVTKIADGRSVDREVIIQIQQHENPMSTEEAYTLGLVDALLYEDEVEERIKSALEITEENLPTVTLKTYARVSATEAGLKRGTEGTIGILSADGPIMTGSDQIDPFSGSRSVGHHDFVENLDRLREDDNVKAIVLRINSPGGAATASDAMWRAVSLAAEEKPLVASFGGVAASGGYYIAAPAHYIISNPLSITGSIGAYGLFFNLGEAFDATLGITFDGVKSAPYADMFSGLRDVTDEEKGMLETEIDRTYDAFVARVASGRDMSVEQVDEIGQGRVWIGTDALDIGLVDELGGLDTAIEHAAELAKLDAGSYSLRYLPRPKSVFERFDALLPSVLSRPLIRFFSGTDSYTGLPDSGAILHELEDQNGRVQLRMPLEIRVR